MEDIKSHLVDIAFDPGATAPQLLCIVLVFAAFWFVVFFVIRSIIKNLVHNKQWLLDALERDYERSTKKLIEDLGIKMTKEEAISAGMRDWPRMQAIYVQHFAGSLFCMPSILGTGDPSVASSLATLGVLSEMGWELQDLAEMFFVRAFFENGKVIWPDAVVAVFAVHHSLTTVLGVPMILYYRENRTLHWLTFNLQFAAAIALATGEYTKVLDVSKPSSLLQMKVLTFITLIIMVWTRALHWTYLCVDLYITWYRDQAWAFLSIGLILSALFTMFNIVVCIKPYYIKLQKFWRVSAEYATLPENATPESRRRSVARLDAAVAELLAGDEMRDLADRVESIFVTRRPDRRRSMPVQSRKRMSLIFAHSQSFGPEAFKKDL